MEEYNDLIDEQVQQLKQAMASAVSESFSNRIELRQVFDCDMEQWFMLVYYFGRKRLWNMATGKHEYFYFFLATPSSGSPINQMTTPIDTVLISLSETQINRRNILFRQFTI